MLKVYNSLTRTKEEFKTLEPNKVKMYVCGPTVYDLLHIGNFRGAIIFNLVRNWLEQSGYEVTFVYNYTDIDDKIINKANEEGKDALDVSRHYIEKFKEDYAALKLPAHSHNPKCSDYMPQMVEFINTLIEKGNAYEVDGSVFYAIDSFDEYGKLSGKNIEQLQAGYRVDSDKRKRNLLDFILWKPAKEGEPAWDSPWGAGRPGWHIECSTMNYAIHGEQIDIHGGGIDLIFPHHENEIAQTEARTGKQFATYWMHNNFINMGDEKMSKSLGNILKARDFIQKYHSEILKFLILSVHYRSLLNANKVAVEQAIVGLRRIYGALLEAGKIVNQTKEIGEHLDFQKKIEQADKEVTAALNDDFNTPQTFAAIFEIVRTFNGVCKEKGKLPVKAGAAKIFIDWVKAKGQLMGLFQEVPSELLQRLNEILLEEKGLSSDKILGLMKERWTAREEKNYKRADEIRDELLAMGVEVKDGVEGVQWQVKA